MDLPTPKNVSTAYSTHSDSDSDRVRIRLERRMAKAAKRSKCSKGSIVRKFLAKLRARRMEGIWSSELSVEDTEYDSDFYTAFDDDNNSTRSSPAQKSRIPSLSSSDTSSITDTLQSRKAIITPPLQYPALKIEDLLERLVIQFKARSMLEAQRTKSFDHNAYDDLLEHVTWFQKNLGHLKSGTAEFGAQFALDLANVLDEAESGHDVDVNFVGLRRGASKSLDKEGHEAIKVHCLQGWQGDLGRNRETFENILENSKGVLD